MFLNKLPPMFSNLAGKCCNFRHSSLIFVSKEQEKRFSGFSGGVLRGTSKRRVGGKNGEDVVEKNMVLELEIFEFMQKSNKPDDFPTKQELIKAGRLDLVEEILAVGGWLTAGWDLEDDGDQESGVEGLDDLIGSSFYEVSDMGRSSGSSDCVVDDGFASSSGRSLDIENGDVGIEGILNRLKVERNRSYVAELREKEEKSILAVTGIKRSSESTSLDTDLFNDFGGFLSQNGALSNRDGKKVAYRPGDWKMWGLQRTGYTKAGSKDNVILNERISDQDAVTDILATGDEVYDRSRSTRKQCNIDDQEKCLKQIHSRIQNLESELTSVLCLLRSKTDAPVSDEGQGSSLEDLENIPDAWEFQETEIVKTRDKLRSMRAKVAVLEGKMTLEITETYKVVEEKQRRIEAAENALSLLRNTCIVWPNLGSEVFLAGSFDGWTSRRRMERASTGGFFLNLKLYPGRYEIKFVVDGLWRIDPLRPVVNCSGYENNLLIIE